mmetsp:Transcript_76975/g.204310  ORF Transcript_76975/g.204310 Transcript_76975/m.204310 type:complete len:215 (+) Transcript_76975:388-1032(+)
MDRGDGGAGGGARGHLPDSGDGHQSAKVARLHLRGHGEAEVHGDSRRRGLRRHDHLQQRGHRCRGEQAARRRRTVPEGSDHEPLQAEEASHHDQVHRSDVHDPGGARKRLRQRLLLRAGTDGSALCHGWLHGHHGGEGRRALRCSAHPLHCRQGCEKGQLDGLHLPATHGYDQAAKLRCMSRLGFSAPPRPSERWPIDLWRLPQTEGSVHDAPC